jgi:hypothetical protein
MSVSEEMIAEGVRCLDMLPLFATPKDAAVAMYLSMKAAEPLAQGDEAIRNLAIGLTPNPYRSVDETAQHIRAALVRSKPMISDITLSDEARAEIARCTGPIQTLPPVGSPSEPLAQGNERELMKGARDIPTPRSGGGMVAPNLKSTPVGGRAPADLFRWLDGDNRKCCCRGRAMAKEHIADLERQIAAKDAQLEAMQAEVERLRAHISEQTQLAQSEGRQSDPRRGATPNPQGSPSERERTKR